MNKTIDRRMFVDELEVPLCGLSALLVIDYRKGFEFAPVTSFDYSLPAKARCPYASSIVYLYLDDYIGRHLCWKR